MPYRDFDPPTVPVSRLLRSKEGGPTKPVETSITPVIEREPVDHGVGCVGDNPCATAHASTLKRATDSQPARALRSVLQLQKRYGNRYVERVLALAREKTDRAGRSSNLARKSNQTGLPDGLKSGVESLSGISLDNVRVHSQASTASEAVARRVLTQGNARSDVIQRLVPLGLPQGAEVFIIRSTSVEFHKAKATIVGPGEKANEYRVRIDSTGEEVFARADQLQSPEDPRRTDDPVQVDFSEIRNKGVEEILLMIAELVRAKLNPKYKFVVGGSFAAFLHAMKAGQFVRTPRDIDIILDRNDFKEGRGPQKRNDILFCGIPLELHESKVLVTPNEQEIAAGIVSPGTLLAKHMKKLRDQQFRFREVVPKPRKSPAPEPNERSITAADLYASMREHNDRLMNMKDGEPDHMSDTSKAVWMKTLQDVETLAGIGAKTPVE